MLAIALEAPYTGGPIGYVEEIDSKLAILPAFQLAYVTASGVTTSEIVGAEVIGKMQVSPLSTHFAAFHRMASAQWGIGPSG